MINYVEDAIIRRIDIRRAGDDPDRLAEEAVIDRQHARFYITHVEGCLTDAGMFAMSDGELFTRLAELKWLEGEARAGVEKLCAFYGASRRLIAFLPRDHALRADVERRERRVGEILEERERVEKCLAARDYLLEKDWMLEVYFEAKFNRKTSQRAVFKANLEKLCKGELELT